jgi:hypothetical protein
MESDASKNILQRRQKAQNDGNNIDNNISNEITGSSTVHIPNKTQNTIPKKR